MKPKFNERTLDDKFCNCVKMKLQGKVLPIKNKFYYFSREVPDVELQLTFNFGEHSFIESKTKTKIEFGITQGKLFLECNNVTMPEESRGFLRPFLIETKMIQSQEENITTKNSWNINLKQIITSIFDFLFLKWGREETKSKKAGFNYEDINYQAFSQGSEKEPVICFQLKQCNSPILVGDKQKELVGIVKIDNIRSWSIKAYFKINIKDIVPTKYEDKSIDELNPWERRNYKLAYKNFTNEMNQQIRDWICYSEIISK
jgi:hypothetical protein